MRFLAIDLGDRRTGLAVGDDVTGLATPLDVIQTRDPATRLREIQDAIDDQGPAALVVGLPLNMDGSEGPRAKLIRAFAADLEKATKLPIHLADERLTSAAADAQMARTGLTRGQKKDRRDALAAATLLRDFLAARRAAPPPP